MGYSRDARSLVNSSYVPVPQNISLTAHAMPMVLDRAAGQEAFLDGAGLWHLASICCTGKENAYILVIICHHN